MRCPPLLLVFLVVSLSLPAAAELYIVPADDELIQQSTAIVIGTVSSMHSTFVGESIITNIDIDVEAVLKGQLKPGARIRLAEPGGEVGGRVMMVSAAPTYWTNNRALIFLTKNDSGEWITWGAALGKFDFVSDATQRPLLVRWAGRVEEPTLWTPEGRTHEEKVRMADRFVEYIRTAVNAPPFDPEHPQEPREQKPVPDYFVDAPAPPMANPFAWDP
ncbi:MAG: hypothetical protein ACLGH0_03955, partial [Thermoanaerobaculia bacterium]